MEIMQIISILILAIGCGGFFIFMSNEMLKESVPLYKRIIVSIFIAMITVGIILTFIFK